MDVARTSIAVERSTEPFSGMPLLRVTGYVQRPVADPLPCEVSVRFDAAIATRCELTPAAADDIPRGWRRFNFGTQLPIESGVREVSVVLDEDELYRRSWKDV